MVGGAGGLGGGDSAGRVGGLPPTPPAAPVSPREPSASFAEVVAGPKAAVGVEATLVDRLRGGEIDLEQYVNARVDEASAHLKGILPGPDFERLQLELRDAIENDPVVRALVRQAQIGP